MDMLQAAHYELREFPFKYCAFLPLVAGHAINLLTKIHKDLQSLVMEQSGGAAAAFRLERSPIPSFTLSGCHFEKAMKSA